MYTTIPIYASVNFTRDADFFNIPEFMVHKHIREILLIELMKEIDKYMVVKIANHGYKVEFKTEIRISVDMEANQNNETFLTRTSQKKAHTLDITIQFY